ncbi:cyclophilin-like fold protein [Actinoplanes sp. NPDC048791]|uniref:cyclophilin-like fold protein n=1 Tax=Actinoplanes sp. NPDC048791 TaxID=3154623 RepID=UPI0033E36C9B
MRTIIRLTAASLAVALGLAACAPAAEPASRATVPGNPRQGIGSVVRFTAGTYSVDVTIGADSPAVRDFLSMLPMRLPFEDLSGREKISYLPRKLDTEGSPGSDPEDGDLIYFVPWGNLGFYYNADGIGYSDATIHLGKYNATAAQLEQLENGPVTVALVD